MLGSCVGVDGLDKDPAPVTAFRDTDIVERRDFRYVYTWRATGLPQVLANRRCFSEAMANDEVVVFDVLPECQAGGSAVKERRAMRVKPWDEVYASPKSVPDMLRWGVTHIRLVDELIRHRSVLEVGTGTSMLSGLASKWCDRVVTLDNSGGRPVVGGAFSAEAGTPLHAVRGDAHHLPFPDQSFSACFSQGLLEHFADDEVRSMVGRAAPGRGRWSTRRCPACSTRMSATVGPGLVGNERCCPAPIGSASSAIGDWDAAIDGDYYADFKIASFAGRTIPWPAQILLRVTR